MKRNWCGGWLSEYKEYADSSKKGEKNAQLCEKFDIVHMNGSAPSPPKKTDYFDRIVCLFSFLENAV